MNLEALGRQALRFAGVGLLATLVHVSVAWLASQTILTDPFQANAVGFFAAFALSYSGHFYFTFELGTGHRQALLRFLLVSLIGLTLSNALVWLITIRLGLPFAVAMAAVGVAVPAVTFIGGRAWAFNRSAQLDLAPILLILAAGAMAYQFYGAQLLNHDTSWYLVATRKWLAGATLYRDVMEINPPLAFFLTLPALWLADLLAIDDTRGFQLYTVAIGTGSLLALHALLRRATELLPLSRRALLAAAALACFVLPMADFGQREHLMVMLALPYVALLALAPAGLRVGLLASLTIGSAAALGLALKPHFLAAPLLLAIVIAGQERSVRVFFHPANLVIAAFCVAYLLLVWLAFPLYFTDMLPLGALVYWALGTGTSGTLMQPLLLLAPLAALAILNGAGQGARLTVTLRWLAAAAGFAIAYLVQGKGWMYQLLPMTAMLLPALAFAAMPGGLARRGLAIPAALCVVLLVAFSAAQGLYRNPYVDAFEPVLAAAPPRPALLMLSARVSAGFPLTATANARWVSRYPAQWVVPGAVRLLAEPACAAPDACLPARLALDRARADTVADMQATMPDVIIADMQAHKTYFGDQAFDYLSWLRQDPTFANIFAGYRLDRVFSGHAIWLRVR